MTHFPELGFLHLNSLPSSHMSLGHYKCVLQFHKGVLDSTCPREFGQRETVNSDLSGRPVFLRSCSKILQRAAEHPMQL